MLPRTPEDAAAVRRGHKLLARLELHTLAGGKVGDLPIEDGTLTVSLSAADGARSGTVRVPGYDWWEALRPQATSWVRAYMSIDGREWFLGEWPVVKAVLSRPEGVVDATLGDWCFRRARSVAQWQQDLLSGRTVAAMAAGQLTDVMPWTVTCTRDDTASAQMVSPVRLQAGGDVWAAMVEAANAVGAVLLIPERDRVEVRRFDPAAVAVDDLSGTVNRITSGEDATELVNKVIITVESEASGGATYTAVRTLTTGPYRFDHKAMGHGMVVDTMRLPTATQAAADAEAQRVAGRRFGVVRSMQLEVVAQPWLQVGDVVSLSDDVLGTARWMVDTITFPLTARGTMRVTMRSAQVVAG